jgi:hypothetical protein
MVHMNQFYTLLTDFYPNLKFKSHVRNFVEFFFFLLVSVFNKGKLCSISFVIRHHKYRILNLTSIFSLRCCFCISRSVAVK